MTRLISRSGPWLRTCPEKPVKFGKVQTRELAAGVHVADPLVDVEATWPHLVVA